MATGTRRGREFRSESTKLGKPTTRNLSLLAHKSRPKRGFQCFEFGPYLYIVTYMTVDRCGL